VGNRGEGRGRGRGGEGKGREGDWCPPHDLFARRPWLRLAKVIDRSLLPYFLWTSAYIEKNVLNVWSNKTLTFHVRKVMLRLV